MLQISQEFKDKVIEAILRRVADADAQGTSMKRVATQLGLNIAIVSRLKNGERSQLISDEKLLQLAPEFNISLNNRVWKTVETDVYKLIEEEILFCKEHSRLRSIADDCGIGKSYTAKYLAKKLPNCFYVPCKRATSKILLVKALAKAIGIDQSGTTSSVAERVITVLSSIVKPVVILDDLGYVDNHSIVQILDLIDSTEGSCGWYVIGDDSLQERMDRGINRKKTGYRALFSRLGKKYSTIVPIEKHSKIQFYKKLLRDVLAANAPADADINKMVMQCLKSDAGDVFGDLRRAESLLILNSL
jgi:hypothetical protein